MMHNYRINCTALVQNNLFREVEIMSYVAGKSKLVKTRADIETFCLYDFLIFLSHAKNRKIIIQDTVQYSWINYSYLIEKNPTLFLNNAKIKRMLSILEKLDLLSIINDCGSIYVAIKNLELVMLNDNQPVMNHNRGSVMNHNRGSVMNHNCNNNKESIITKNQEYFPPYIPPRGEEAKSKSESLFEDDFEVNQSSCLKAKNQNQNNEYSQEFETFWNEYPRRINKKLAFKAFQKALKSKISLEVILEATKAYKSYLKAKRTKSEYIMHPSSWLNGECYQNDYESELTLEEVQKQNVMKRGTMDWGSNDDDGIF